MSDIRTALVTGASRGLGRALAAQLAADGWQSILTGRDPIALAQAPGLAVDPSRGPNPDPNPGPDPGLAPSGAGRDRRAGANTSVVGDVADPRHHRALARVVADSGGLDLLILNAGTLGPAPLPPLREVSSADLASTLHTNAIAQHDLVVALLPLLSRPGGTVLALTSDAAAEHYPSWGAYGASKAALEHLMLTFSVEEPDLAWYVVDPGDLRTDMHQAAFPEEDISDRPLPASVTGRLVGLIGSGRPSGRYRIADLDQQSAQAAMQPASQLPTQSATSQAGAVR